MKNGTVKWLKQEHFRKKSQLKRKCVSHHQMIKLITGDEAWSSYKWYYLQKTQGFRWEIKSGIKTELNLNSRVHWKLYWNERKSEISPMLLIEAVWKCKLRELTATLKGKRASLHTEHFHLSISEHHYKRRIQTCHSPSALQLKTCCRTMIEPNLSLLSGRRRAVCGITATKHPLCLLSEPKRLWNIINSFSLGNMIFSYFFLYFYPFGNFLLRTLKKGIHIQSASKIIRATNQVGSKLTDLTRLSWPPWRKKEMTERHQWRKNKNLRPMLAGWAGQSMLTPPYLGWKCLI